MTVRVASGQERTRIFDAVMVCTGAHSEAVIPPYSGLDTFEGEVMHSRQVRKGADCAGKNVLVVGTNVKCIVTCAISVLKYKVVILDNIKGSILNQ